MGGKIAVHLSTGELLLKHRLSDNVGYCQVFFERTNLCTPKSAPFRSR